MFFFLPRRSSEQKEKKKYFGDTPAKGSCSLQSCSKIVILTPKVGPLTFRIVMTRKVLFLKLARILTLFLILEKILRMV